MSRRPLAPILFVLVAPACSTLLGVDFDSAKARATDGDSGATPDGATPACARDCAPQVCDQGQCVDACTGGRTACSGTCVDLSNTTAHCGACDRACTPPAFGEAACRGGNCDFTCDGAHYRCGDQCCANGGGGDGGDDGSVGPTTALAIGAGFAHTCAVTKEGRVLCWGKGDDGELGDGRGASSPTPVYVSGIGAGASAVCAGTGHACAVVGGAVKCWGDGFYGQLGNGGPFGSKTPVDVRALTDAKDVGCGEKHTCALRIGGGVQCWGDNSDGQLGDGNLPVGSQIPKDVSGLTAGVSAIAVGYSHTCALVGDAVQCWGLNGVGQVGAGTQGVPTPYTSVSSGAVSTAAGAVTSCAGIAAGGIMCWGYNGDGEIVPDGGAQYLSPTQVPGTSGIHQAVIGVGHACGLGNPVLCWGDDRQGQQGTGTVSGQRDRAPAAVVGVTGATQISAGGNHTCALVTGGHVFCWGANDQGQLGKPGTPPASAAAVEVENL